MACVMVEGWSRSAWIRWKAGDSCGSPGIGLLVERIASQTVAPSSAAVRAATDPTWPVGPKIITGAMVRGVRDRDVEFCSEGLVAGRLDTGGKVKVGSVLFKDSGTYCSHLYDHIHDSTSDPALRKAR